MSAERANGGPAFPGETSLEHFSAPTTHHESGMSLRDYFAAKALASLVLQPQQFMVHVEGGMLTLTGREGASRLAYMYADEMLKAREQVE